MEYAVPNSGMSGNEGVVRQTMYLHCSSLRSSNIANNSSMDKMDLALGQGHGEGTPEQETHETDKPTEGSGDETVG